MQPVRSVSPILMVGKKLLQESKLTYCIISWFRVFQGPLILCLMGVILTTKSLKILEPIRFLFNGGPLQNTLVNSQFGISGMQHSQSFRTKTWEFFAPQMLMSS